MALPLTPEQAALAYFAQSQAPAPAPAPARDPSAYFADGLLGAKAFGGAPPPPRPPAPEGLHTPPTENDPFGLKAAASGPPPAGAPRITALPPEKLAAAPSSGPVHADPFGLGAHSKPMMIVAPDLNPAALPKDQPAPEPKTLAPVEVSASPQRPRVGGGVAADKDPYGVRSATDRYLSSYGDREDAARRRGAAEADAAQLVGSAAAGLVEEARQEAAIQRLETDQAEERFAKEMDYAKAQQQAIQSKRVDPTGGVSPVALGLTALFSMALQGGMGLVSKGRVNVGSPFMDLLNKHIDRTIAEQERQIGTEKAGAENTINMLGQHRQFFRDSQAAKSQARIDFLNFAEKNLNEMAEQYQAPVYQQRAEERIGEIRQERAKEELALAEARRKAAMAGSAGIDKETRAAYIGLVKTFVDSGYAPAQAEYEAKRHLGISYGLPMDARSPMMATGDPLSGVPKELRTKGVEELHAKASRDKVVSSIDAAFKDWNATSVTSPRQLDSVRSAISGTIMANVPGVRSDIDFKEIIEPNLPRVGDSAETLRRKHGTVRRFVESKTATPILDTYGPQQAGPAPLNLKPVK